MAVKAKEAAFGTFKPTREDEDYTHVVLTYDEYWNMRNEAAELRQRVSDMRQKVENDVSEAYKDARRQLADDEKKMRTEVNRRVSEAQEKQAEAEAEAKKRQAEAEQAHYLNRNLQRIMRERANQKRGLSPKKEHDGYIVLSSEQADYRYRDGTAMQTVKIWRTVIQSWHDATIPINQVYGDIETDLHDGVLYRLRIQGMAVEGNKNYPKGQYTKYIYTETDDYGQEIKREGNYLFDWKYKANYKSGFWELTLYHTKSIIVPEDMRPTA